MTLPFLSDEMNLYENRDSFVRDFCVKIVNRNYKGKHIRIRDNCHKSVDHKCGCYET